MGGRPKAGDDRRPGNVLSGAIRDRLQESKSRRAHRTWMSSWSNTGGHPGAEPKKARNLAEPTVTALELRCKVTRPQCSVSTANQRGGQENLYLMISSLALRRR